MLVQQVQKHVAAELAGNIASRNSWQEDLFSSVSSVEPRTTSLVFGRTIPAVQTLECIPGSPLILCCKCCKIFEICGGDAQSLQSLMKNKCMQCFFCEVGAFDPMPTAPTICCLQLSARYAS